MGTEDESGALTSGLVVAFRDVTRGVLFYRWVASFLVGVLSPATTRSTTCRLVGVAAASCCSSWP